MKRINLIYFLLVAVFSIPHAFAFQPPGANSNTRPQQKEDAELSKEDLVEKWTKKICEEVWGNPKREIWNALSKMNQDDIASIARCVIRIGEERWWSGVDYKYAINTLKDVKKENRDSLISCVLKLSKGKRITPFLFLKMINALKDLTNESRDSLVSHFTQCDVWKEWDSLYYATAIAALADLKAENRDALISQVARLAEGNKWERHDFVFAIKTLKEIKKEGRDALVSQVAHLLKGNKWDRWDFFAVAIKTLNEIKKEGRDALVSQVAHLLKGKNLKTRDYLSVIRDLQCLDEKERDLLIPHIIKLADGKEWGSNEYAQAVRVSKTLAQKDRKHVDSLCQNIDVNLGAALEAICYIPSDQLEAFVNGLRKASLNKGAFSEHYNTYKKVLLNYVVALGVASEQNKIKLLAHWNEFFFRQSEKDIVGKLIEFIFQHQDALGLYEEHTLMQTALRTRIVLLSVEDEKSPYGVYKKVLEKRKEDIDWKKLGKKAFTAKQDSRVVLFDPEALYHLVKGVTFNLEAVPTVEWEAFKKLITDLKNILKQGKSAANSNIGNRNGGAGSYDEDFPQQLEAIAIGTDTSLSVLLDGALNPDSYHRRMLDRPKESVVASKLKCVIQDLLEREESQEKWKSVATFLTSVRHCRTGQNDTVHNWYMSLPPEKRAINIGKVEREYAPALRIVTDLVQKYASQQLSPEKVLMKKICGVGEGEEIQQASHQIQYVKGAVGDKIGLSEKPAFDLHTQVIYEPILHSPAQELVRKYYDQYDPQGLVGFMQSNITKALVHPKGALNKELYESLEAMLPEGSEVKTKCFQMNEDWEVEGITEVGVTSLLKHKRIGIVREFDEALSWAKDS